MKLPILLNRQTLIYTLVITLTTFTLIQCTSPSDSASAAPNSEATKVEVAKPKEAPNDHQVQAKSKVAEASVKLTAESIAKSTASEPASVASTNSSGKLDSVAELEVNARKGRSEPPPQSSTEKPSAAASGDSEAASKQVEPKASSSGKPTEPKQAPGAKLGASANKQHSQQLSGKSGSSSPTNAKKLPANLGTVTSTGSGGPAHYMSKHDAYSAIAEKHGALAQDAMRKADKRQHLQRFGGIQKASGFSEVLSPFKGVTDSGLARTLGASVRSIMKSKYSVPAYLASAVLGAVALMAFYESPISPLPVPPLPEPPVGRFPPEMPNISPNLQVPFRMNQQQGQQQQYGQNYQRSSGTQQVFFPGATAQQRQMTAGPVQQLAANLISSVSANRQTARADYDQSSSRSFFGQKPSSSSSSSSSSASAASSKLSTPANSQQSAVSGVGKSGNSLLSYLGFGGNNDLNSATNAALASLDIQRASGLGGHQIAAGGGPISLASGSDHKLGQSALSNSHLVNKMKSYFDRPVGHSVWPVEQHAPNQYDQYRRMSIIQALAKDTAFLSSFFSSARRSSNATIPLVSTAQLQKSISSILSAAAPSLGSQSSSSSSSGSSGSSQVSNAQQAAAARMQVDNVQPIFAPPMQQQRQAPIVNTKRASSGYGLMRAADRVAHALLDTFSSGLLHRSSSSSQQADSMAARKSEEQQQNAIASATSLLSDIMSSYNAQQNNAAIAAQAQAEQGKQHAAPELTSRQSSPANEQATSSLNVESPPSPVQSETQASTAANLQAKQTSQQAAPEVHSSSQPIVRKTRSIGLEYPTTEQQMQQPSRASQINSLVDMVSDSYKQNKLLFSFVMNQVGLSHAVPYVDQFLGSPNEPYHQYS